MCYPSPGPRCPSAALLTLEKAEHKWNTATTVTERNNAMTEIMDAKKQYDMTIQGQKQIESLIEAAKLSGETDEANRLSNRLEQARHARQQALEAIGVKDGKEAKHQYAIPTSKEKPNERTNRLLEMAKLQTNTLQTAEGWKKHLDFTAKFSNLSFNNQILLNAQNPDATNIHTYDDWRRAGRVVQKAQESAYLLSPTITTVKKKNETTGRTEAVERITGFRSIAVFDEKQTTGKDLPAPPKVDLPQYNAHLAGKLNEYGYTVEHIVPKDNTKNSVTSLDAKKVYLRKGMKPHEQTEALAKELSHIALGHGKTPPKDKDDLRGRNFEAASLSYVLKKNAGIDDTTDFSPMEKWQDKKTVKDYGQRVSKAAKYLLS